MCHATSPRHQSVVKGELFSNFESPQLCVVNMIASEFSCITSHAVVDFLSLRDFNGTFIVKELAININGSTGHWIFKKPFFVMSNDKTDRVNRWVTQKYHGMKMDEGDVPYTMLQPILLKYLSNVDFIYTKGLEKCRFLENILNRAVINLDDFECPKHFQQKQKCLHHMFKQNDSLECAFQNCNSNYEWSYFNVV